MIEEIRRKVQRKEYEYSLHAVKQPKLFGPGLHESREMAPS
jgi:hypothetical protein